MSKSALGAEIGADYYNHRYYKGYEQLKEILFFLITIMILLTLKRISNCTFKSSAYIFIYIILVIGFIGGNYYSIFMHGTLLINMLPEVSFKQNEVIRWSSIMVCVYLGLLIPKRQSA